MRTDTAQTIYRQDYRPYPYRLSQVRLEFDLAADSTRVHSVLRLQATDNTPAGTPLILDGEDLTLIQVLIDDQILDATQYQLTDTTLQLTPPSHSGEFTLEIISDCNPTQNTTLMGLYVSGDKLFTQCEAQGFRRITWFPDRPDVMAIYEVVLRANPTQYPTLLSNGNLIEQSTLPDGRHQTLWRDPHPKPCYLFALVAGDFDCIERTEATRSGRSVLLQVYSDRGCKDQTHWALDCLARALHWDETRFGLELDLDRFMVVAARDFNMGAMENKGLNVFNAAYVLADPASATDSTYRRIEDVIGHEYFHNWTGNRVTCRDWFQLSLKEGLTVFREQEFSADMLASGLPQAEAASARAVKRIDDVHVLRMMQFPEDAGPMAHSIRPDSYQEIGNFYTATVYEKGAEVIRMQHTLLGEAGFQEGMAEYFRRHDGQAVTCDDFVNATESIYSQRFPGQDFSIFRRWYKQAGTPRLYIEQHYDASAQSLQITLRQQCDPVGLEARQVPVAKKPPLHIPVAIGLLDGDGQPQPISWQGKTMDTLVLQLTQAKQSWMLEGVKRPPVLSLLRGFSAPVIIASARKAEDLALLARTDTDPFARWDATQETALRHLLAGIEARQSQKPAPDIAPMLALWQTALEDQTLSPAYRARLLGLPALRELIERSQPQDPQAAFRVWRATQAALGAQLATHWRNLYAAMADDGRPYSPDPVSAGRRSLRNLALSYLLAGQVSQAAETARQQYAQAKNMTESLGALNALLQQSPQACTDLLQDFHTRWQHDPLVLDNWFGIQASAPANGVAQIRALMALPDFTLRTPNRARAVIFRFVIDNPAQLHTPEGYDFWAEQVLALNRINPEVAARLARAFDQWARFEPTCREGMQAALQRVRSAPGLSRNVSEIISKALDA
ncbi:aminopeptidase N [Castellaniella sp.]|uniref:aminopeptidase N n=1 Tax=Castellaniella sp. TaxID=1955812 RepID=UPI003A8DC466